MSSGAARAAGVPNPAAPSMKAPKMKPMMMACSLASGVIPLNMPLMAAMAPDWDSVFMIRIAPKIMTSVSNALRKPRIVWPTALFPSKLRKGIFQSATPIITATIHARGSALLAGQLKPTIRTMVRIIGTKAINAYITFTLLVNLVYLSHPVRCRVNPSGKDPLPFPERAPTRPGTYHNSALTFNASRKVLNL